MRRLSGCSFLLREHSAAVVLCCGRRSMENMRKMMTTFAGGGPKFFTFNDGWTVKEGERRPRSIDFVFQEFLPNLFPNPSQYEIGSVPW